MPKEVRVVLTEEEYERLKRVKGSKSWREFLLERVEMDSKERLTYEINNGFNELKARVAGIMQDNALIGILEVFRVLCIRLAHTKPEEREEVVKNVEGKLLLILQSLPYVSE